MTDVYDWCLMFDVWFCRCITGYDETSYQRRRYIFQKLLSFHWVKLVMMSQTWMRWEFKRHFLNEIILLAVTVTSVRTWSLFTCYNFWMSVFSMFRNWLIYYQCLVREVGRCFSISFANFRRQRTAQIMYITVICCIYIYIYIYIYNTSINIRSSIKTHEYYICDVMMLYNENG